MNNIPTKLYKKYNNNVKNKEYSHQSLKSKIQQKIFDKNNKIKKYLPLYYIIIYFFTQKNIN